MIRFIDQLHGEHPIIPSCLGIDDQFYRMLLLSMLESANRFEGVEKRFAAPARTWASPLDDPVDYVCSHTHLALSITDLEERSHYSARHLFNLFREMFDCTPMQSVRRQRLSAAMERLQTTGHDDSITMISRDCGYRHVSHFTADFRRQFGVTPSVVLRASRFGGNRG